MQKSNLIIVENNSIKLPEGVMKKLDIKNGDKLVYFIDDDELILGKLLPFEKAHQKILSSYKEPKNSDNVSEIMLDTKSYLHIRNFSKNNETNCIQFIDINRDAFMLINWCIKKVAIIHRERIPY